VNLGGTLYSLTFARPVAIHVDPVEKLPMQHILPGQSLLSLGTAGCNFSCLYCINSHISQKSPRDVESLSRTPAEIVGLAKRLDLPGIAFTYNEPTIAYEFMYDTFTLAKNAGLKTFFHSNGFMEIEPLIALLKVTDGIVVDLKAFSDKTYRDLTGGEVSHVKEFLKTVHSKGTFLEVVNLIVPNFNDNPKDIEALIRFVKNELSPDVPLHFSRFFPKYKLTHLPPTPSGTIRQSIEIAEREGLHFVYANNINLSSNNTVCPRCKKVLVERIGERIQRFEIRNGRCPSCGYKVPGIWEA
jgi:pyruvate formate lyase activating enzyme